MRLLRGGRALRDERHGRRLTTSEGFDLHEATVSLTEFGWNALSDEAERQGIPVEELLAHAAMYYVADLDAGRLAARVPGVEARRAVDESFR
jgi:hypothetical protein